MKEITHWPHRSDLTVEDNVYHRIMALLVEPFDTEDDAQRFWKEFGCSLVVLSDEDNTSSLITQTDALREKINHALNYPEFRDHLDNGYQLHLAITSDEGGGIYLLISSDCPLIGDNT